VKKLFFLLAMTALASLVNAQVGLRLKTWERDDSGQSQAADVDQKTRMRGRSHLLVQFADNPTPTQLVALANRGASVLSYVPNAALSISVANDAPLDGLGIRWIGRLHPAEKISPDLAGALAPGMIIPALVEFYADVDMNDARSIANQEGAVIRDNPDLLSRHLLLSATSDQIAELANWDEVAYIFLASDDLIAGVPVRACMGALTTHGSIGQSVAMIDDGWDGPGRGGADLKYVFVRFTEKLPADAVKAEIARAFNEWAKYAKLTFTLSFTSASYRTIAVLFASGAHGDGYPFDGPNGVIAHTFYPTPTNVESVAGDIHFDNDESWKIGADPDVFSIALHETGHALGLGHSDDPNAVMYPYYRVRTALTQEDISAILKLYAAQDGTPAAPLPAPTPAPPTVTPLAITMRTPPSSTIGSSISINGTISGGVGPVQITWTTHERFSGIAQGSDNWSISAIPLNPGDNVITITARDSQQNQATRSFTVTRLQQPKAPSGPDTTAPSLTILSPASTNVSTSATSIAVSGTASDNTGVVKVTWTSSTGASGIASGTTNWSVASIPLYIGTTTIVVRASDAAGNTSWRSIVVTRR
jgi:matrixin